MGPAAGQGVMLKKPDQLAGTDLPFGAVPLRAAADPRLTPLDFRVLIAIACRDRMSEINGGDGCWAKHKTLAADVGCHHTNLSKSIGRLVDFGYVQSHKSKHDRRRYTLIVRYQRGKIVGQGDHLLPKIVGVNRKLVGHADLQPIDELGAIGTLKEPLRREPLSIRAVAPATRTKAKAEFEKKLEEFWQEFWQAKPSRGKNQANPKEPARAKFIAAVRAGTDPHKIIAAAKEWARQEQANGNLNTKFVPTAVVWLNQKRFNDYAEGVTPLKTYRPPGYHDDGR